MKRKFLALLIAVMTFMLSSVESLSGVLFLDANAADYTIETYGLLTYKKYSDYIEISDCDTSFEGEISVPAEIDGIKVTKIGYMAFYDCRKVSSIILPDTITSISSWAFTDCNSLSTLTIPQNVTYIADDLTFEADNLTAIEVDCDNNNYCSIDGILFSKDKTKLIKFPCNYKLTEYIIPDFVTSVSYEAFRNCKITDLTIPYSVTSIGDMAFYYTRNLENIYVDDNNQYFSSSDGVLYNKAKTKLIKYGGCNSNEYSVPDGVVEIGGYAFDYCDNLKKVSLPDSIEKINVHAFSGTALSSINLPENITYIGEYAFDGCSNLVSINLPTNLERIGRQAFQSCNKLTSINIPDKVYKIESTFNSCNNLKSINVDSNNLYYSSVDGVLFNKERTELIEYPRAKENTEYYIPEGVEKIGDWSFTNSKNIKKVIFPESLIEIGEDAFSCTLIKDFDIPASVSIINKSSLNSISTVGSVTIRNPNCFIYDSKDTLPEKCTIYGYSNSTAKKYANNYNRNFVLLSDDTSNTEGGSYRFSLSDLGLKTGDVLNINVLGDAGDTIQVHFYYTDKDGNASSSLVGGLGGTALDANGKKTVSFIAPNDLNYVSIKIVYNKSLPTYTYDIKREEIVTQPARTTTTTTTTTTKETTTVTTTTNTTTIITKKDNKIIVGEDNYSFLNQSAYFNSSYNISDKMKRQLNSKINNLEWEKVDNKIAGSTKWEGSCYGMSAVEILAKAGKLDVSSIDRNAKYLYDWKAAKKDLNVESIINYYHMLQYSDVFESKSNKFMNMSNKRKIDSLIDMTSKVENGGNLVLVGFNFTESPSSKKCNKGHAIVAYGVEYGSWSYSEKYNCRILISDPNVAGFASDNCIYINTENYHWEIPYYQEKYYNCKNTNQSNKDNPLAQIRMATNDLNLIDTFGYLRNGDVAKVSDKESKININNNTNDFGVAYFGNSSSGDLNDATCDLIFYSGMYGTETSNNGISAILPEADVPYEYFEKGLEAFDTSIEYTNSKLRVDVSSGSYAIYKPNESVEFVGNDSTYTISMVMNDGYHPTDWFKFEVKGENADSAKIATADGGYIISSDSLSDGIFINASNRNNKAYLGIATEYKSIFVYEIDETKIGIKVDKNGDGIYETKYTPNYLADINADGNVSVADAVLLQKYLLGSAKISKKQFICGDINMDGYTDVFDMVFMRRLLISR